MSTTFQLVIESRPGWQVVDLRELWYFRELLGFLVWRDIKIRYKQTALGGLWAILQPLIGMLIFGFVFHRVARIESGGAPYSLFAFAGLVPWTFFANAVSLSSNSLVGSEQMIRKIYFPRILVPIAAILALGLDLLVGLGFLACLMAYYGWGVSVHLLALPLFVAAAFLAASSLGLLLSSLNVQFRDVKYVVPFFTQMALFLTPVIYPASYVPERFRWLLALNPMTGVVEGFRYALLGSPLDWALVWTSLGVSTAILTVGMLVFGRMERSFADVI